MTTNPIARLLRPQPHKELFAALADSLSESVLVIDGEARMIPSIVRYFATVSRAVANKGVALPDGRIIPLARFFDRSLSIRDRIKEIVKTEKKPLTDDQIAAALRHQGVKIARRTVAKYRTIEGILPARLRKLQEATA